MGVLLFAGLAWAQFTQEYPAGSSVTVNGNVADFTTTGRTKVLVDGSGAFAADTYSVVRVMVDLNGGSFGIGFRTNGVQSVVWRVEGAVSRTVQLVYSSNEGVVEQWNFLPAASRGGEFEMKVQVTGNDITTICYIDEQAFVATIPLPFYPDSTPFFFHLDGSSQANVRELVLANSTAIDVQLFDVCPFALTGCTLDGTTPDCSVSYIYANRTVPGAYAAIPFGTTGSCETWGPNIGFDVYLPALDYVMDTCDFADFESQIGIFEGTCAGNSFSTAVCIASASFIRAGDQCSAGSNNGVTADFTVTNPGDYCAVVSGGGTDGTGGEFTLRIFSV